MNDSVPLSAHLLHLTDDLRIDVRALDAHFWTDRDRPELATGRLVSVFDYDATWDYRERHPTGDELAFTLRGDADLLLGDASSERAVRLPAGSAAVVPAGTWHRLAVREPCSVLFVTPTPARTEHRRGIAG